MLGNAKTARDMYKIRIYNTDELNHSYGLLFVILKIWRLSFHSLQNIVVNFAFALIMSVGTNDNFVICFTFLCFGLKAFVFQATLCRYFKI